MSLATNIALKQLTERLERELAQALNTSARQGLTIAREETGKSKVLRRLSSQAASKRKPAVYVASWTVEPARTFASGETAAFLVNASPVVKSAPGSEKSAIAARIRVRLTPILTDEIEKAVHKAARSL